MGGRGVISDKWSMRVLWGCAIGSAIRIIESMEKESLYMVAADRKIQNRERAMAESLKAMEAEASGSETI